ncbi:MmcQ/YjbR family DNA-binding protein [Phenylobacterium sp.]|uniref:MmcQ/YjbR family DNA-binding protein n=1 Tax=Phenylobacterium sp. TaxID=1871053 RepID=UPI0025E8977C|nr:MmcQ/YjbR family DNA-binding protein [Phenylobacterium sp.]
MGRRTIATFDDLRRLAVALPGAEELTYRGEPWFNVGRKTFALGQRDRTILKLERGHQDFLFEVRPDTFQKFTFGPNVWSYVVLEDLDEAELADLVREAWAMVVPKRISRPVLAQYNPLIPVNAGTQME